MAIGDLGINSLCLSVHTEDEERIEDLYQLVRGAQQSRGESHENMARGGFSNVQGVHERGRHQCRNELVRTDQT